jgi:hypothetical protein
VDETQVVGELAEVWKKVRRHLAALAARAEFPDGRDEVALGALERDELVGARHGLAVPLHELGLVVERVDVADGAGAEDDEDSFRARGEMRISRRERRVGADDGTDRVDVRRGAREQLVLLEQVEQRHAAEPARGVAEERPAVEQPAADVGERLSHISVA